jgi:septal ring factor EnvC (AmiA/AmiB activator)
MNAPFSAGTFPSSAFRRFFPGLVLACVVSSVAWPAPSGGGKNASPTHDEVAEKKTDLKELREQIEALRKEMAAAEGQRASAVDELRGVESEISTTQRELRGLSGQKNRLQAALKNLGEQERALTRRLDELRAQREDLARRQYLQGQPDALRLLLNGKDANQMARDLYYLNAIAAARKQLLDEVETLLERKRALSESARERASELSSVEDRQKEQHARLLAQRERRKETLFRISSEITRQRKEIGSLERDEKQLTRLIARLDRLAAARAAQRRAEAEKARSRGEAVPESGFAALQGKLRPPVRGTVTNRYGSKRQEGSTWKGLFIRAAQGSDVMSIADGRVAFADWLRGFGNLMIVDHGGGYLSVYGYNDALLKQVGDAVRGGDPIAVAGHSGGHTESGLYFELRHQGEPVDPLQWMAVK